MHAREKKLLSFIQEGSTRRADNTLGQVKASGCWRLPGETGTVPQAEESVEGAGLLCCVHPRAPRLPSSTQAFLGSHLLPCAWVRCQGSQDGRLLPSKPPPVLPRLSQGICSNLHSDRGPAGPAGPGSHNPVRRGRLPG